MVIDIFLLKRRFFENVHIRKSFRTKKLLEKYWDGTITGYFFDDAKKWINKKRAKKQAYVNAHFTDEIVKMEREIRADAREWLKPILAQAKQNNLDVKLKYYYVTKDSKELKSRPQEGYTYSIDVEISHYNEIDENKITDIIKKKFKFRKIKKQKSEYEIDIKKVRSRRLFAKETIEASQSKLVIACPVGKMTKDEKNAISHRGKALRKLEAWLDEQETH